MIGFEHIISLKTQPANTHLQQLVKRQRAIGLKQLAIHDLRHTQQDHVKLAEVDDEVVLLGGLVQLVVHDVVRIGEAEADVARHEGQQAHGVEQRDVLFDGLVVFVVRGVGLCGGRVVWWCSV